MYIYVHLQQTIRIQAEAEMSRRLCLARRRIRELAGHGESARSRRLTGLLKLHKQVDKRASIGRAGWKEVYTWFSNFYLFLK
jgi:hypothetical protein